MQAFQLSVLLLLGLASSLSVLHLDASLSAFCWRDSYGRGVGVLPSVCPNNKDKIGLLCYTKCPIGYSRFGFDCHQNCPLVAGWADQGLFCRLAEYGRGSGYPWRFGDALNDKGMLSRCQADKGMGNCEKNGLIYYPKCKPGYYNIACCICRPNAPNCGALGFNGGLDLSCAKKIIVADPMGMDCTSGQVYDAGLCYSGCKTGFNGAGPVCWGPAPTGWVGCGMGAAKDTKTCTETVLDEVSSVGNLAMNVFTYGAGKAAKFAKGSTDAVKLKSLFDSMKSASYKSKKIQDIISKGQGKFPAVDAGKSTAEILKADSNSITPEDMMRVSSQIAALAAPTGVSDVVSANSYPKCSTITV